MPDPRSRRSHLIPSGRAASSRSRTSEAARASVRPDLQVLGLTRCPGGGSASVRDLRVRRETSGIGDGQPCPANSPFNGARDVPVAGETHPASLGVPDNHAGSDGKHTRWIRRGAAWADAGGLRVGHQPPPGPAPVPPPRARRDHASAAGASRPSARSGSRCPWPGRRRSHSTASSGSPPPRPPRPGRSRPASPARASRGPARRRGDPTGSTSL